MVDTAVNRQQLVGVAIQTDGGIGTQSDGIDNFLSRAVMTGGTGTSPVGGNIVRNPFDFRPVRHGMTAAAEDPRRVIGKVSGTHLYAMGMGRVNCAPCRGMAGGTVTAGSEGLASRQADPSAIGVVTAGTGVMHLRIGRIGQRRRIAVTVAAGRRRDPDQRVVARGIDRMGRFPGTGMAGGTVATNGEGLADRQADPCAGGIVTAGAGVMHLRIGRIGQRRRITVTVAAGRRRDLDQRVVGRGVDRVNDIPGAGVAGEAVAAANRDPGLKGRNGRMAEATITEMGHGNRRIGGGARIVTVHTGGRSTDHVAERQMVDRAMHGQLLVRMAIQTMGRVGLQGDGVNNFLSRAVVTGGTGAGPVGGDIVRDPFDFSPVRHSMTVAAELPRGIIGEVVRADFNRVGEVAMIGSLIGMAIGTGDLSAVQPLLNHLPNDRGVKFYAGVVVAEGTVGTVQSVNVSSACQGSVTRSAENRSVAGMTGSTGRIYDSVVMRRSGCMQCGTGFMASIAGNGGRYGTPGGKESRRDKIGAITIGNTAGMVSCALIMTCGTGDGCSGGHIISSGPDRLPVMTGQNIGHFRGMTIDASSIRRCSQVMQVGDSRQVMTIATGFTGKGQVRPVTVLIDAIIGNIDSPGMDAGVIVIAVIGDSAA